MVQFEYEEDGAKYHQDLIDLYAHCRLNIVFDFQKPFARMHVICEQFEVIRTYSKMTYQNRDTTLEWLIQNKAKPPSYINLCHIYLNRSRQTLIKTADSKKNFVLKINRYDILEGKEPLQKTLQHFFYVK